MTWVVVSVIGGQGVRRGQSRERGRGGHFPGLLEMGDSRRTEDEVGVGG